MGPPRREWRRHTGSTVLHGFLVRVRIHVQDGLQLVLRRKKSDKTTDMKPLVRRIERLGVDVRGLPGRLLVHQVVLLFVELFLEEVDADSMGPPEMPHRGVLARGDDMDARLVVFMVLQLNSTL